MIKRVFIFVFAVMTVLGARAQWSVEVMAGYDYKAMTMPKGMLTTCVMRERRFPNVYSGAICRAIEFIATGR